MQKCCEFKHYNGQKLNVKVIKATHRRINLSKTFVSQEIFARIGLRENMLQNFQNFGSTYNFANIRIKPDRNG